MTVTKQHWLAVSSQVQGRAGAECGGDAACGPCQQEKEGVGARTWACEKLLCTTSTHNSNLAGGRAGPHMCHRSLGACVRVLVRLCFFVCLFVGSFYACECECVLLCAPGRGQHVIYRHTPCCSLHPPRITLLQFCFCVHLVEQICSRLTADSLAF